MTVSIKENRSLTSTLESPLVSNRTLYELITLVVVMFWILSFLYDKIYTTTTPDRTEILYDSGDTTCLSFDPVFKGVRLSQVYHYYSPLFPMSKDP